jgi:anti-sigma B factor antagonist
VTLNCVLAIEGSTALLTPAGDVDLGTAPLLQQTLEAALACPGIRHIEVDLQDATFLDSTGVSVLVAVRGTCREQGVTMTLAHPRRTARALLEIVGLLDILISADTVAAVPAQARVHEGAQET